MKSVPDQRLSRHLTALLRHRALERGLPIAEDGYVAVSALLDLPEMKHIVESDVVRVVEACEKQRFSIADRAGVLFIRANQGHSMPFVCDDLLLVPVKLFVPMSDDRQEMLNATDTRSPTLSDFPICVHGTSASAWSSIRSNGLQKMSRNHIHFATGIPNEGSVQSGMRKSAEILIYCDLEKALHAGMHFYVSANRVLLTPGVTWNGYDGVLPPGYFLRVVNRRTNEVLFSNMQDS